MQCQPRERTEPNGVNTTCIGVWWSFSFNPNWTFSLNGLNALYLHQNEKVLKVLQFGFFKKKKTVKCKNVLFHSNPCWKCFSGCWNDLQMVDRMSHQHPNGPFQHLIYLTSSSHGIACKCKVLEPNVVDLIFSWEHRVPKCCIFMGGHVYFMSYKDKKL